MSTDTQIEDSETGDNVVVCASGVPAAVLVTTGASAATDKSLQELADERFDERMYQKWVKQR